MMPSFRVAVGIGPTVLSASDPQGSTGVRCWRSLWEIAEVYLLMEGHRRDFLPQCCWRASGQLLTPRTPPRFMGPKILEMETAHTTLVGVWRPGNA